MNNKCPFCGSTHTESKKDGTVANVAFSLWTSSNPMVKNYGRVMKASGYYKGFKNRRCLACGRTWYQGIQDTYETIQRRENPNGQLMSSQYQNYTPTYYSGQYQFPGVSLGEVIGWGIPTFLMVFFTIKAIIWRYSIPIIMEHHWYGDVDTTYMKRLWSIVVCFFLVNITLMLICYFITLLIDWINSNKR